MEFHPSQLPVIQSFEIEDERKATEIAGQMVMMGFATQKGAFRVIMKKEQKMSLKARWMRLLMSEQKQKSSVEFNLIKIRI